MIKTLKDKKQLATVLAIAVILTISLARLFLEDSSSMKVSAVEVATTIGLYWDANCSRTVDSVSWGNLTLGEEKKITVYVRNKGNRPCILTLTPANWQGGNTSNCMTLTCEKPKIEPSETVQIAPTLLVFLNASGISSFAFDIIFATTVITIADFDTLFSNNPNISMIYPSDNSNKPLNCKAAMVSDWTASAFVFTKLTNVTEGLDTQSNFVNQTTGKPLGASGTGIISFGGPVVNPVLKYAESDATPQSDRAPIRFHNQNGVFSFQYSNGSSIPGADMPATAVNGSKDIFVIETLQDRDGRYIMLCYGLGWKGTYAAGKYFDTVMYPSLKTQDESWIIVEWEDTNGNGFVNGPNDGDTYTIIAEGN
jgi:hypothetical protein